jgi:hypothetical protein
MYRKRRRVRVYHKMDRQQQCRLKEQKAKCGDGSNRVRMWKARADTLEHSAHVGVVAGIGILSADGCELGGN